jgi:hypothetical protein
MQTLFAVLDHPTVSLSLTTTNICVSTALRDIGIEQPDLFGLNPGVYERLCI